MTDVSTIRAQFLADVKKAEEANLAYRTGDAIMSDEDYDRLVEGLEATATTMKWSDADQLLNVVSGGADAGGDVEHTIPMLSLAKVNGLDALETFAASLVDGWVLEPKLDGIAVSVLYEDGELVRAATRGDGRFGEDITDRIADIHGLPAVLPDNLTVEVRGEVFMTSADFEEANRNRLRAAITDWATKNPGIRIPTLDSLFHVGQENRTTTGKQKHLVNPEKRQGGVFRPEDHLFANSRNAVAGSLMRKAGSINYRVPMSFAAYDLITEATTSGHASRMLFAQQIGVATAHDLMPMLGGETLAEQVEAFGHLRPTLDFPTDGVVIKADGDADRERLGSGTKAPRWAFAYKYVTLGQPTQVLAVIPSVGRTGQLTLRAQLKPVLVDGTVIEFATLNNPEWVAKKDIRIGDTVSVRRANDVIPFIDYVDTTLRPADAVRWEPPAVCVKCGGDWDKSSVMWRCFNPSCSSLNSIIFAAGRDYFDWEGLSTSTLTTLNEKGLVKSIADVFRLDVATLSTVETGDLNTDGTARVLVSEKEAVKLIQNINASKQRPFHAILAGLGIRHLGRSLSRRLVAQYPDIASILALSVEELRQVEGFGQEKAVIIHQGLQKSAPLIKDLLDLGVRMEAEKKVAPVPSAGNPWAGKNVVISGSIPGYRRSEAQDLLQTLGANPQSSVSKTTDLLIADEAAAGNSKYVKAQSLGVAILSPEEFLKTLPAEYQK